MTNRSGYKPPKRNSYTSPRAKRKNAKSGINKLSDFLYGVNKTLRDVNAFQRGKIVPRIERRLLGKLAARGLGSKFLRFFGR